MQLLKKSIESEIMKITVNCIKRYRCRGPEYVKVRIEGDMIEIAARGLLTNLARVLINSGEEELVKVFIERARGYIYVMLTDEIYEKTKLKCVVVFEKSNFEKDERILRLQIIEGDQYLKK